MHLPCTHSHLGLIVLALVVSGGACAPVGGPDGAGPDGGSGVDSGIPQEVVLANLRDEVARATCAALFRCCNVSADLNEFFAPIASKDPSGRYATIIARVPPNAPLTESECPSLMQEILDADYLGSWVAAAEGGYVTFRADEAASCLASLDEAACGLPVRNALYDSTCFGLGAPEGGDEQRRVFARNASVGEACRPVVDGFGAYYYGTCNPMTSFCCNENDQGNCMTPSLESEGKCRAISAESETCSTFPVQLCATGIACAVAAGAGGEDICVQESRASLPVGALCYDDSKYLSLGVCENGYCDYFSGMKCKAFLPNGEACIAGYECGSGACVEGVCGLMTTCESAP